MRQQPSLLRRGTVFRVVVDVAIVNVSLFLASLVAHAVDLPSEGLSPARWLSLVLSLTIQPYARASLILSAVAVGVFYACGFYTFGRVYRGRYKAFWLAQAVTLAYGIFGVLAYLQIGPPVSRGLWLAGWVLTAALIEASRFVADAWTDVAKWEERLLRQRADGPIRRVLVIGGAGYIGSTLVRQLLARGYVVRVLDALFYGDRATAALRSNRGFEFVRGDFRNVDTVVRCMQDVDAVVHLGAIVGDPASDLEPEITREINVVATRLIADVARGSGVRRLVFASTCSVYGSSDDVLTERSPTQPLSLYAKSKLASEDILLGMVNPEFSPVVLRFGTLYGLGHRPRFDLVANLLVAKAMREGSIVIVDGHQWRPFLHVADAARAIGRCLEASAEAIAGQIFNVGSTAENYQFHQLGAMVCDIVPGTQIAWKDPAGPRRNYRVCCDKIAERLGFRPVWTLRQGMREVRDALARGDVTDYTAREYDNFKVLAAHDGRLVQPIGPLYPGAAPAGDAPPPAGGETDDGRIAAPPDLTRAGG